MSIGSSHTWWTCPLILFPFFTGSSSTLLGMWACIQLSLVGLLVLSSRHRCDMSWLGVLLIILFFSIFFIWFGKYFVQSVYYDETIHTWRLWWLSSSVVRGILFKDINSCSVIWSPSMNSAGRSHFLLKWPWRNTCIASVFFCRVRLLWRAVVLGQSSSACRAPETTLAGWVLASSVCA